MSCTAVITTKMIGRGGENMDAWARLWVGVICNNSDDVE